MIKRVVLKIYGDVQGVFYRANTQAKAKEFDLVGWVRNESDGTVKIMAEGKEENLRKLIEWCYNGVRYAKVEKVKVKWQEAKREFDEFSIQYL